MTAKRASAGERLAVTDVCEVVYSTESWHAYLAALTKHAPAYATIFGHTAARFDALRTGAGKEQAHLAELKRDGIRHQVLHGGPWRIPAGTVNDEVAAYAGRHREILSAWAGVSLSDPDAALDEAKRCLDELGMTGLSVIPFLDGVDVLDDRLTGLWVLANERRLPVWIHCGTHFRPDVSMDISGPLVLDRLAGRYPEMRIVAGHGGWPGVAQMLAVAQRHPNVWLELSSHRPSTMRTPGSGWEPLWCWGTGPVQSKVLFGSATWTQGRSVRSLADDLANSLARNVAARWLSDNATALLGLNSESAVEATR